MGLLRSGLPHHAAVRARGQATSRGVGGCAGSLPSLHHAPFTAIILDFFQARGGNEEGAADVQAALRDTALSSTGTSQSVEKLHARVQVSQNTIANSGRKPATVQRESYVLSARIAHSRLKGLIEKQVFGVGGLARARKLMGSRVVSRTKAANSSLRDYAPKQAIVSSHRRQSKFVKDHVLKAQKKCSEGLKQMACIPGLAPRVQAVR